MLAQGSDAIERLEPAPGSMARLGPGGEEVRIVGRDGGLWRLADGRTVDGESLWPLDVPEAPVERLARGEIDPLADFANRLDAVHLRSLRESGGLGTYLGGRIRIFSHQLYVAERASAADPVRWLLADEVGLGKTVEACLILNRLARSGRADRILVVAPSTLTVQWLGELYRKFHQVFVLLDEKRMRDVERDFGAGFNPFDAHARAIIALEQLVAEPSLSALAAGAGYDLLILDEAHRLERAPAAFRSRAGGGAAYRAVAPLAAAVPNVLLLTGTPLETDAPRFFHLLGLLRPDEYAEGIDIELRLRERRALAPCTSATRRKDIGGLPPRVPAPVEVTESGGEDAWGDQLALEARVRRAVAQTPSERRRKADRYRRALASPAALLAVLGHEETLARAEAERALGTDPRAAWLARHLPAWRRAREKTLVFVAHRETLEWLRKGIERATAQRVGIFHEDLQPARADIEVAQFRLASGPTLLIATECGGEGRNFQFCKRLVLFDLPWDPSTVEQRIGRLDRIDRRIPVEVVYFRAPRGLAASIGRFYEDLGALREPLAGLETALEGFEDAVETAALDEQADDSLPAAFREFLGRAREDRSRIQQAAYHELHRDPFRAELAAGILARIPTDLEETTAEVVLGACERYGFDVVPQRGEQVHAIEFGNAATIEHLPGVPPGSRFLGTFDRDEAVENETIDFFASGHPLVEGILQEIEEGSRGRAAFLEVRSAVDAPGFGLFALYEEGSRREAVVVDEDGNPRPEWTRLLMARPLRARPVEAEEWTGDPAWPDRIRLLASRLGEGRTPAVVAAFRVVPFADPRRNR